MNIAFRIWLTAVIYQSVIFSFTLDIVREEPALWILLLPIELLGGLPGLLAFIAGMKNITGSRLSYHTRWALLILLTFSAALGTTSLTAMVFDISLRHILEGGIGLIWPAPASALLALLTYVNTLKKHLS